jgi:glutamate dehydrogenase (NAD(P)+)
MPDFIVNAGGVICAAMEYAGTTEAVLDMSIEQRVTPREAAVRLASERVRQAMSCRRWSIF